MLERNENEHVYITNLHVLIECLVIWYKMYKLKCSRESGRGREMESIKTKELCVRWPLQLTLFKIRRNPTDYDGGTTKKRGVMPDGAYKCTAH